MGLRLTLNQLPDGGEGSIPSRLTKKKEVTLLTIILILIFAAVFVVALAVLYHSLSGKAEEEDMLEQVARFARAQDRLNTRLEELEEQILRLKGGELDEINTRLEELEEQVSGQKGGELDEIKRRLEELESDTAGGNAALDQMFLAGINGIMNYGMKDAIKRG